MHFSFQWRWRHWTLILLILVFIITAWMVSQEQTAVLGAQIMAPDTVDTSGFERARPGQAIQLPADHGPHPTFQTEWWYFTGNVEDDQGGAWGYQFTIFRRSLTPAPPSRASAWTGDQLYLAHVAISDVDQGQHQSEERIARAGAGLAGGQIQPVRIWLEDWQIEQEAPDRFRLKAAGAIGRLDLELVASKPAVYHGQGGYSQKGPDTGNASYYYSYTRLATSGVIEQAGREVQVSGYSWMDHEWSTGALGAEQVGWDWFSLQLSDDWELMVFQLRQADGSIDPSSSGTLIAPDGSTTSLNAEAFSLNTTGQWRSDETQATYPSGWQVIVPDQDLSLTIKPLIPDQEMRVFTTYWEGAVEVIGRHQGQAVDGRGYVELTGYAESMQNRF